MKPAAVVAVAAVPLLGWAAVLYVPEGPVWFGVPLRFPLGLIVAATLAYATSFAGLWALPALAWFGGCVMAWTPMRAWRAVGWVPPIETGPALLLAFAGGWWWLLWRATADARAARRERRTAAEPDDDDLDDEPQPSARARHAALAMDDDDEDDPAAEPFEAPPSGPLREPVRLSLAYRPVAFDPPENEPEAPADGSLLDQLAAVWPERRRTEKGAVHVADLADLVGWDEANLAAELEAEGLLVKDVTARPLNVRGAGATSKRGVRWASLRDRAVATGVATS